MLTMKTGCSQWLARNRMVQEKETALLQAGGTASHMMQVGVGELPDGGKVENPARGKDSAVCCFETVSAVCCRGGSV